MDSRFNRAKVSTQMVLGFFLLHAHGFVFVLSKLRSFDCFKDELSVAFIERRIGRRAPS